MKVKAILNSGYFANARHAANYIAYIDRQSPIFDQNGTEKRVLSAQADVEAPGNSTVWYHDHARAGGNRRAGKTAGTFCRPGAAGSCKSAGTPQGGYYHHRQR